MNEANVKALADIIAKIHEDRRYEWPIDDDDLARYIADMGVLVPGSLTEQEVGRFDSGCGTGEYEVEDPVSVADWIDLLERIAKG